MVSLKIIFSSMLLIFLACCQNKHMSNSEVIKLASGFYKCYDLDLEVLSKNGRFPRCYNIWTSHDTVFEYKQFYTVERRFLYSMLFIKTPHQCTVINVEKDLSFLGDKCLYDSLRNMANNYKQEYANLNVSDHVISSYQIGYPHEQGYITFNRCTYEGKPAYVAKTVKDSIIYYSPIISLSTTPGFEGLIEKRKSNNAPLTVDGVFSEIYVDKLPFIANNGMSIKQYVDSCVSILDSNVTNLSASAVILQLTISSSGILEKATIARSVGKKEDKLAFEIISHLPQLVPAKKNGKHVAVRMTVPVRFIKDIR